MNDLTRQEEAAYRASVKNQLSGDDFGGKIFRSSQEADAYVAALEAELHGQTNNLPHLPFCNAFGPTPCACICEVVSKSELAAMRAGLTDRANNDPVRLCLSREDARKIAHEWIAEKKVPASAGTILMAFIRHTYPVEREAGKVWDTSPKP